MPRRNRRAAGWHDPRRSQLRNLRAEQNWRWRIRRSGRLVTAQDRRDASVVLRAASPAGLEDLILRHIDQEARP